MTGAVWSIIASAATILALVAGWWFAGAKRRRIKRERRDRDDMATHVASGDVAAIAGMLNDLGLQVHAYDKRKGRSGP